MHYRKHIFFCTNQRSNADGCGDISSDLGFTTAKQYLQQLNLWGEGKYRASKSGCLGRCKQAPVCVIYPEGKWYTYVDEKDIHQIIDLAVLKDQTVEHLLIDNIGS